MPDIYELDLIYKNRDKIKDIRPDIYWSSTSSSGSIHDENGILCKRFFGDPKDTLCDHNKTRRTHNIRCVRIKET